MRNALNVVAHGDREIRMMRSFDAPREMVFEALTKPELLKRWLYGPDGWSLADCEVDLRVGGAYRYLWRHVRKRIDMGAGGVFREIVRPERIVCTEVFDDPWYPGESLITTVLEEKNGRTAMKVAMLYESTAGRDGVLKSPMDEGVSQSYDRLERILAPAARA
jgi:uncharacterized protein YndB with AHSA1/START domain